MSTSPARSATIKLLQFQIPTSITHPHPFPLISKDSDIIMGLTFTFPPHPSAVLKTGIVPKVHIERDPHDLPTFDANGEPTTPIMYLPPLLSSLPHGTSIMDIGSTSALSTETHLPDIDPASLSLHKALHKFSPVSDAYADLPYAEGFNWSELELPEDEEREWYIVAFRSKRRDGSDGGRKSFLLTS